MRNNRLHCSCEVKKLCLIDTHCSAAEFYSQDWLLLMRSYRIPSLKLTLCTLRPMQNMYIFCDTAVSSFSKFCIHRKESTICVNYWIPYRRISAKSLRLKVTWKGTVSCAFWLCYSEPHFAILTDASQVDPQLYSWLSFTYKAQLSTRPDCFRTLILPVLLK